MYLGIDVGGTKTLTAVLNDDGVIEQEAKFPTPSDYEAFVGQLAETVQTFGINDFQAAGVGVPGNINRAEGIGLNFGNLAWQNVPLQASIERLFHCPTVVENDANLAGLSESMLHKDADLVLYITVSTGIGTGVVYKQQLVPSLLDSEGGHMLLPYKNQLVEWEDFASGRAIVEQFGKPGSQITDEATWKIIARNLSLGIYEHIAVLQPNLVIIGGSMGSHFSKYETFLLAELKKRELPLVQIPRIIPAERPEKAVIYGCYDLAKDTYGHHR